MKKKKKKATHMMMQGYSPVTVAGLAASGLLQQRSGSGPANPPVSRSGPQSAQQYSFEVSKNISLNYKAVHHVKVYYKHAILKKKLSVLGFDKVLARCEFS